MFLQIRILKLDFEANQQDYDTSQSYLLLLLNAYLLKKAWRRNTILESHFWKFRLCQILWEIVGREEKNDISCQLVLEAKCPLYSKFGGSLHSQLAAKLQTSIIFPRSKLSLLMLLRQIFLAKHLEISKSFIMEKYENFLENYMQGNSGCN